MPKSETTALDSTDDGAKPQTGAPAVAPAAEPQEAGSKENPPHETGSQVPGPLAANSQDAGRKVSEPQQALHADGAGASLVAEAQASVAPAESAAAPVDAPAQSQAEVAPEAPLQPAHQIDPMKGVRAWLWLVAALVFIMVIVGGATRLTESGLSITEWKPVTGVLPPISEGAWQAEFDKYKKIPQYSALFPDMNLTQFKTIFFWEWSHRLLGRLIGLVFALGLAWFAVRRVVRGKLLGQLAGVLVLGGLQGVVGWWMVASGLVGRVEVAPERLAVHLLLAALTFIALIWIATGLKPPKRDETPPADVRRESSWLVWLFFVQIGLGALVAGARAGLTYNTWPLMDGHLVPATGALMKLTPWWLNFLENPTMIQFQHRMFAYLLVFVVIGHFLKLVRLDEWPGALKRAGVLSGLVLVQVGLGIATLLLVLPAGKIPLHAALAHQAVAFMVLAMAVVHARRSRPVQVELGE